MRPTRRVLGALYRWSFVQNFWIYSILYV